MYSITPAAGSTPGTPCSCVSISCAAGEMVAPWPRVFNTRVKYVSAKQYLLWHPRGCFTEISSKEVSTHTAQEDIISSADWVLNSVKIPLTAFKDTSLISSYVHYEFLIWSLHDLFQDFDPGWISDFCASKLRCYVRINSKCSLGAQSFLDSVV